MPDRERLDEPMDDHGTLPRRDVRSTDDDNDAAPGRKRESPTPPPTQREPEEPQGPSGAV